VFTEAQVLRQLDHPAIIRISECGYVDAASKGRPHIIMDYFQGQTLEEYVKKHGAFPVEDLLLVAKQVAEGLQAAHGAKILHRDVKPANLLVRKEATGWKVKIIDFGLAMPQKVAETSQKASTAKQKQTMIGSSVAGTLDYAAPEQMGKLEGISVCRESDIFAFGKTCCFALFQTPQPLLRHWRSIPKPLAKLLETCMEERPEQRPASFTEVLDKVASFQNNKQRQLPKTCRKPWVAPEGNNPLDTKTKGTNRFPQLRSWQCLTALATTLLCILLLWVFFLRPRSSKETRKEGANLVKNKDWEKKNKPKDSRPNETPIVRPALKPSKEDNAKDKQPVSRDSNQLPPDDRKPGNLDWQIAEWALNRGGHIRVVVYQKEINGFPPTHQDQLPLVKRVSDMPQPPFKVRSVSLDNQQLTNNDWRRLGQLTFLTHVVLRFTNITDEGLAFLVKTNQNFLRIDLEGTNITDVGVMHLAKLPELKDLIIRGTKVSTDGREKLRTFLPRCAIYGP
jgi:serine/threonine protein kinase